MRYLYNIVLQLLPNQSGMKGKALSNTYWLFADQLVRMGVGFFILMVIARAFGPEAFGKLNYAIAFVSLFSVFSTLGIEKLLVRDVISDEIKTPEILSTGFYLKLIGSFFLFAVVTAGTFLIDRGDATTNLLVMIFAATSIFQSFDVIEYWYQARMESKFSVFAKIIPFLFSSALKILIALFSPSIVLLGLIYLGEAILSAIFLFTFFKSSKPTKLSTFQKTRAILLLKEGFPLIFSTIFVTIYMKIDQVILQHLSSSDAVGIYSAAVRISELPFFAGIVLTNAAMPVIMSSKKISESSYYHDLKFLFSLLAFIALAICLIVFFASDFVVLTIYGKEFLDSAAVLKVHIWSLFFVFLGLAQSIWIVSERLTHFSLIATVTGALANIALNVILIPTHGPMGAALATVISYAISAFLINFVFSKTRPIAKLQAQALLPTTLYTELRRKQLI